MTFYQGKEIPVADLVTRPENSLIHQSTHARERPEPLNGDGFGLAWYVPDDPQPARFRSLTPAWNNANLVLTDGRNAVACRFSTDENYIDSLYINQGSRYRCEDGVCWMAEPADSARAVLISSEPLNEGPRWKPLERNQVALVSPDCSVSFRALASCSADREVALSDSGAKYNTCQSGSGSNGNSSGYRGGRPSGETAPSSSQASRWPAGLPASIVMTAVAACMDPVSWKRQSGKDSQLAPHGRVASARFNRSAGSAAVVAAGPRSLRIVQLTIKSACP